MMDSSVQSGLDETAARLRSRLLAEFNPARPWVGHLSSSAVATAVAVFALHRTDPGHHASRIARGVAWLEATQNLDGGWGDSPESPANLTATLLTWFALSACRAAPAAHSRCEAWLARQLGGLTHDTIVTGVIARYGGDRTFAAPILTMAALADRLGPREIAWTRVPALPFELAALPPPCFRLLNLAVVSYALPALIAVGLAQHRHSRRHSRLRRALRDHLAPRLLEIAHRMQPSNGGYEEATPLTAFVCMCLAAAGYADHEVVQRGVRFLTASQRPDGSWPIDSDLATWLTVHAVLALTADPQHPALAPDQCAAIRTWLLAQQHTEAHPLTFGAPGGWGWTDLPGAMPDADDTAGVLLALHRLGSPDGQITQAAERGVAWLLGLQNRDGGIPTFARGWGRLPFDRSCPDLTAHAMQALLSWNPHLRPPLQAHVSARVRRMLAYLRTSQTSAGAWSPLWFGTQGASDELNLTYGTARTLAALQLAGAPDLPGVDAMAERGRRFLALSQHPDGGWGAQPGLASTIEETAVALTALADAGEIDVLRRGAEWLMHTTKRGTHTPPSPIGLYFARLWYSESLYPVIFSAHALALLRRGKRFS